MFLSRICLLALALAAGLTAPLSAATWNIQFFDGETALKIGTGSLVTPAIPTVSDPSSPITHASAIVNGVSFAPSPEFPLNASVVLSNGFFGIGFNLFRNGNSGDMSDENRVLVLQSSVSFPLEGPPVNANRWQIFQLTNQAGILRGDGTFRMSVVPLPASAALLLPGLGVLVALRRRRRV